MRANRNILICWILFLAFTITGAAQAQKILTLDEAMQIAMTNSPDIRSTELSLERSRESLNAERARLKSQFSLTLTPFSYERSRQFNTFFSTWNTSETKQSSGMFTISQPLEWTDGTLMLINQFGWQDSYSEFREERDKSFSNNLYLSFQQPIFTYNRTKLALRELELDMEYQSLNYAIRRLVLEKDVTQVFYLVHHRKLSNEIAVEELNNQEQSLEIIRNKVDAGLVAQEELYQAELNLATSNSKKENARVSYENALDNLKKLIGISLFDEISVIADVSHQPVEVDLQMAIDSGLQSRMELRQRKIDIENAQFNLTRTSAMNEFKGNVELTYGIIGTSKELEDVYEAPTKNQKVSLSLEIPLWDWGEKRSRIKASQATIKSRELSMEDQNSDVIIGIRQAYRNLKNQEIQIEIARQSERNAQLTYDINLERYKNGDLTSMDLSLFQNQLSQKKIDLVEALINYKLGLLDLKIQSLYDFVRDETVLPTLK